ncbi:flavodoxin, short chain [Clostridium sp. DSM 8431]|nr:flavodoxin, short chain [Clostridium sp. DSM 8431]
MKIMKIVFFSGTGNTEKMANLISDGIKSAGKEVELISVESASLNDVKDEEIIILGCPAYGDESLESSMDSFVDELDGSISGKKVALFGSYGWGDGTWMREWEDRMKGMGAILVEEGLIVNEADDDDESSIEFGKKIARL